MDFKKKSLKFVFKIDKKRAWRSPLFSLTRCRCRTWQPRRMAFSTSCSPLCLVVYWRRVGLTEEQRTPPEHGLWDSLSDLLQVCYKVRVKSGAALIMSVCLWLADEMLWQRGGETQETQNICSSKPVLTPQSP